MTPEQPNLPEGYYLDNVLTLFAQVESLYADLLEPQQLEFLHKFSALTQDAQRLYIRLLNRSHTLFRLGKLNYPELASIDQAINQLAASEFLIINPPLEQEQQLRLFNKSELLALHHDSGKLKKLKRVELDRQLLQQADKAFFSRLYQADCLLQVAQKDHYTLCQMLFFGNLNQSMTDFVLRDLGLHQYENYRIDTQSRPYTSHLDIQQHWLLHQLDLLIQTIEPEDIETRQTCFDAIPADTRPDSAIFRHGERIKYQIARQTERLDHLPLALQMYRQCALPPSRERITRILHKQNRVEEAIEHCQNIIDTADNQAELQFARSFGKRLVQRHNIQNRPTFETPEPPHKPELIDLELTRQHSVEQAVVDYYLAQNDKNQCYYLENTLFNGVLGLLIWDAVFAPLPGAFYNPFQHRPADFYAPEFQTKRASIFTRIWSRNTSTEDIWRQASRCWQDKFGRMNPLVNWQALNLEVIELALQRIPFHHWMKIFERILLDLRNNRAGFPDLILFPADGGYQLIEVKGPGDSLQKNQQRWMQYFCRHDIPHAINRVRWKPEHDSKPMTTNHP